MKILEKYYPYSFNISIIRSSKAIILFLVTFLKYIFIAARQNTWLGKRLVQVLVPTFIGLIGIQGRKLRIMKSRKTIIEFVQRSTEPKSVSVNKRSISCCLNTRFLPLKGRERERKRRRGEGRDGWPWNGNERIDFTENCQLLWLLRPPFENSFLFGNTRHQPISLSIEH